MDYIADVLGITVIAESWSGAAKLAFYLNDLYAFKKVTLAGVPCIFVKPNGELGTLSAIKKHIQRVQEAESLPVVVELDSIAPQRRRSLIGAGIPFVVPGYQLYLPFMGVVLSERYPNKKPAGDILMPSAQLLLFHYLYQRKPELYTHGMDKKFNLSAMQISRALRQIEALGLLSVRKDGIRTVLYGKSSPANLFEQAFPCLLDPVRKRIYAEREKLPDGMPLSGFSALAELTRLSEPMPQTFAFYGKTVGLPEAYELIDNYAQIEVEVWKYDPVLLSEIPGIVDPLSLAVSLQTVDDARVEQAVEEMLEDLWGTRND